MRALSAPSLLRCCGSAALVLLLAACGGGGAGGGGTASSPAPTPGMPSALASAVPESSGDCAAGGLRVRIGFDANGNGALDTGEVSYTELVCTSGAPATTLTSVTPEPAGARCPAGGQRVAIGQDTNADGTLQAGEVLSSAFVCDGAPGATGTPGAPGAAGPQGPSGANSLLSLSREPAGTNCATGGTRVDSGWDTDRNGTLDLSEVTQTAYVCTGAAGSGGVAGPAGPGGAASLLLLLPEPAGTNCATGGTRVQSGPDTNGNGSLDAGEVSGTAFVCNGADASARSEWEPAQLLSARPITGHAVATGPDGTVVTLWAEQTGPGAYALRGRHFTPGAGWGPTTQLAASPDDFAELQLATDGTGNALASWAQVDGGQWHLHYAYRTNLSGWGSFDPGIQNSRSAVGVNVGSDWVLAFSGPTGEVMAYHWSVSSVRSDAVGFNASTLAACVDGTGRAHIVGIDASSGTSTTVWAVEALPDQAWSAPRILDTVNTVEERRPALACSASGHAVMAWQPPALPPRVARYVPGSGWEAAIDIDGTPAASSVLQRPAVAIDSQGNALVAWSRAAATGDWIRARYVTAGGAWQFVTLVTDSSNFRHPDGAMHAAFDSRGRAHLAWSGVTASGRSANVQRFDPAATRWGRAVVLDEEATQEPPMLAFDGLGRGMALWPAQRSATEFGLRYSHYR